MMMKRKTILYPCEFLGGRIPGGLFMFERNNRRDLSQNNSKIF
ncbi:hypothetical protein CHCC20375_3959 [Bacillus licheniformis]|nr:hypothetical protein CHCC20375_3959 [Bacillus licheniformis]